VRAALLLVVVTTTLARAEPSDVVGRPITSALPAGALRGPAKPDLAIVLGAGELALDLTLEVNLAFSSKARPLSLAPDLWLGATSRLTIGLVHSNASVDRFEPGGSVCLRQDETRYYCDRTYRGSGLDARYAAITGALSGALSVAPRARVLVRDVDPFKPAVTLGALAAWSAGRYAVRTDPYLQIGLASTGAGNRAQLWLPLQLAVQPTCGWEVALHTGWNSELAVIRDGWKVPLALGVRARATTHVDIGATLGFASLLGPQNTPKQRVLFVSVGWRP
jgi:hypothetical protein